MCGRYSLFTGDDAAEINRIVDTLNRKYKEPVRTGEIFPTNRAPILLEEGERMEPQACVWGYPDFRGKGVLINARAETATEKKTFRESVLLRRCLVPSTGFYEWSQDAAHQKYLFRLPGQAVLYMAGLYSLYDGGRRFVILTTQANASVSDVHRRMPVVLTREAAVAWVFDREKALCILHQTPPMLEKSVV